MKPRKSEYDVGKDVHGRTVTLIFEDSQYARKEWTIHVEAANQRDETQCIRGLTPEVILAMAEAVKAGGER